MSIYEPKKDNRTMICIWVSRKPGVEAGHISIQTPKSYISLWPDGVESRKLIKTIFGLERADYKKVYEDDIVSMERKPEIIVCLYSLNVYKMEEEFEKIKLSIHRWALLGKHILLNLRKGQSCSGLAYDILSSGGIDDLMYRPESCVRKILQKKSFLFFSRTVEVENKEDRRETKSYADHYRNEANRVQYQNTMSYTSLSQQHYYHMQNASPPMPVIMGTFNTLANPINGSSLMHHPVAVSPDNIKDIVLCAKRNELLLCPSSKDFDPYYGYYLKFSSTTPFS
jgi:hypothetical protein